MPDAIMSVGMILLNERFEIFEEYKFQKYAPMVGLALVVIDFGYLLSIFRMKYQGYPYRFVVFYSDFLLMIFSFPSCSFLFR